MVAALRQAASELRTGVASDPAGHGGDEPAAWIEARALELASSRTTASLRRVINATGVILHTNLGRAPIAAAAAARAAELATRDTNLALDLATGTRGHRHVHAERLHCLLTGAEAALVVNNAAAAALLALSSLAASREVIVSRGELVEIGGGFRVPEILAQSGAVLREVGTTNRTRVSDYAAAIGDRTALLLRVHPSNFQISGFTELPDLQELVSLARRFGLPLIEDLGSGWLGVEAIPALANEPSVRDSIAAGADLVIFSGDKLLGGPQAGIVVGRREHIDRLHSHPLMRALRVDKLTYGALEGTLALWAEEPSRARIPIYEMLTAQPAEIEARAKQLQARLADVPNLQTKVTTGQSTVGGGSSPGSELPTWLLALRVKNISADELSNRLRLSTPPVVTRIQDDHVVLDLRTVLAGEDEALTGSLRKLIIVTR
jgi:L-seryl-tRNA(Ser) seleniumtransferase